MKVNKHIQRDNQEANKAYNDRSLANDYRHLSSILKPGMKVLDIDVLLVSFRKILLL